MHDTACSLRPVPNAGQLPAPEPAAPNHNRASPFPKLVRAWTEVIGFDFITPATSEEGIASHPIHGPFIVEEITVRGGLSGTVTVQMRLAFTNDSPAPQVAVAAGQALPSRFLTDGTRTFAAFFVTSTYQRQELNVLSQTDLTRIAVIVKNDQGTNAQVFGTIQITHLVPRSAAAPLPAA